MYGVTKNEAVKGSKIPNAEGLNQQKVKYDVIFQLVASCAILEGVENGNPTAFIFFSATKSALTKLNFQHFVTSNVNRVYHHAH